MGPTGKSYSFRSCVRASEAACARGTMLLPRLGCGTSKNAPRLPVCCVVLRALPLVVAAAACHGFPWLPVASRGFLWLPVASRAFPCLPVPSRCFSLRSRCFLLHFSVKQCESMRGPPGAVCPACRRSGCVPWLPVASRAFPCLLVAFPLLPAAFQCETMRIYAADPRCGSSRWRCPANRCKSLLIHANRC